MYVFMSLHVTKLMKSTFGAMPRCDLDTGVVYSFNMGRSEMCFTVILACSGKTLTPEQQPYNNKISLDMQGLLELQENEIHNNIWGQSSLVKEERVEKQTTDKQDRLLASDVNEDDIPSKSNI